MKINKWLILSIALIGLLFVAACNGGNVYYSGSYGYYGHSHWRGYPRYYHDTIVVPPGGPDYPIAEPLPMPEPMPDMGMPDFGMEPF